MCISDKSEEISPKLLTKLFKKIEKGARKLTNVNKTMNFGSATNLMRFHLNEFSRSKEFYKTS